MSELYLRQPWFTYRPRGLYTKHLERIKKSRDRGDLKHIYESELDKVCFAHDAAYSGSKGLAKTTISYKLLKDRAYEIAINPKYDGYQRG